MTVKDRRRLPRTHSNVDAELYDPRGRMVIGEAHFVNMSETGGMVESAKPLRPRQTVRLHLQSGGHTALELMGRVVWTRRKHIGFTYGISFSDQNPSKHL